MVYYRPVALWHFSGLHYYAGHDSRACGDHWVSSSLKGAMCAPLHLLVVLLCSMYRAFLCTLLFQGSPPLSRHLYFIFYIVLFSICPVGSPLFFQFRVTGAWAGPGAGFFLAGRACGWVPSRAGSRVFWLLGFGITISSPPCSWAPNLHM